MVAVGRAQAPPPWEPPPPPQPNPPPTPSSRPPPTTTPCPPPPPPRVLTDSWGVGRIMSAGSPPPWMNFCFHELCFYSKCSDFSRVSNMPKTC